ncbi:hypothetical protein ABH911_005131 [Pseudomonas protegens]|uniref:hypothetical protein n=1 Tax=Pseudomonas protegens TaxID=380021 RepID=UPI003516768C
MSSSAEEEGGLITALNDRSDKSSIPLKPILFCTALKTFGRRQPPLGKDLSGLAGKNRENCVLVCCVVGLAGRKTAQNGGEALAKRASPGGVGQNE